MRRHVGDLDGDVGDVAELVLAARPAAGARRSALCVGENEKQHDRRGEINVQTNG